MTFQKFELSFFKQLFNPRTKIKTFIKRMRDDRNYVVFYLNSRKQQACNCLVMRL